jgi:hypothetical protein
MIRLVENGRAFLLNGSIDLSSIDKNDGPKFFDGCATAQSVLSSIEAFKKREAKRVEHHRLARRVSSKDQPARSFVGSVLQEGEHSGILAQDAVGHCLGYRRVVRDLFVGFQGLEATIKVRVVGMWLINILQSTHHVFDGCDVSGQSPISIVGSGNSCLMSHRAYGQPSAKQGDQASDHRLVTVQPKLTARRRCPVDQSLSDDRSAATIDQPRKDVDGARDRRSGDHEVNALFPHGGIFAGWNPSVERAAA